MPSPPQRGARERELREARDQLRDQHGETDRQQPWLAAATHWHGVPAAFSAPSARAQLHVPSTCVLYVIC
jgi:hypothetical protein